MGIGVRVWLFATMVGCSSFSEPNHAPVVEPQALATEEDRGLSFDLVVTDEDGDDISLRGLSSNGGFLVVHRLTQTREGGVTRLVANVGLRTIANWYGDASLFVEADDGDLVGEGTIAIEVAPVNDAPAGADDRVATSVDTPVAIFASTLLGNDIDVDAEWERREPEELGVKTVANAFRGTVTLAEGVITFVPEVGFSGTARFAYTVSDGKATDEASVVVDVAGPNAAPIAKDDNLFVMEGDILRLRQPGLTKNDVDHDGQTLAVIAVSGATHGEVTVNGGIVTFTPEPSYFGIGGFDYTVTDGVATATAHAFVEIAPWI